MGTQAKVTWPIKKLNQLFDSFTDVNYHTEAQGLGIAIDWIEDGDKKGAKYYMDQFNDACKDTLEEYEEEIEETAPKNMVIDFLLDNMKKMQHAK